MDKIINIFGDSITWGACDAEMGGWVNRLKKFLEKNPEDDFEVYNIGISGDNSEKILKRFSIENETRNPDTIIIAIGINDSMHIDSKGNPCVLPGEFENNLGELIKKANKFTKEIIFVGITSVDESKTNPVSWNPEWSYNNEDIAIYDTKIKEICEKNKISFIEMMDLLKNDDLEDGLHPNATGHAKMFLRIKEYLKAKNII